MSSEVKALAGHGIPLIGDDIDTDRIIPARFLKCVTFDNLGNHVFKDDRQQASGAHPFDQPQYQGATILIVSRNFGCGSSREHAPQAIARWGIQAIVGISFAEIFFGNCLAMGIPCLTANEAIVNKLQSLVVEDPQIQIDLDIENLQIHCGPLTAKLTLADGPRQMLVAGTWDACGQLVDNLENVRATAAKLPYIQWAS